MYITLTRNWTLLFVGKVKTAYEPTGPSGQIYPDFRSISKWTGVFLLPLDGMLVHHRVSPGINLPVFIYSCFEKGCLTNGEKLTWQCQKLLWVMVVFTVAWMSKPQGVSAWWKETAQTRIRFFSSLVAESPWTSIKQSQTLTTHNTNRHCRVRFYTFVGQPLWKQLYIDRFHCHAVKK